MENPAPAASKNTKPISTKEKEAVIKAAQYYVDGLKTGNVDHSRKGFHPNAGMYGWLDKDLKTVPIQELFDMIVERGCTPELIYHMDIIAITPSTAIVEVDSELENGGFRDHLAMVKVDGEWKTVAKLFHIYEQ
ncbi:hypothetical protein TMEN_6524 [Trichophyton mentagrophytes]|uniref:Lumazine-binding protein n=2 Tax=Trichophyton TaxID=5550 RepID=F2PTU3_TRIEC|nr:hypothetical protein TESG_07338 [Trichophyton tonsurans CBS 112818]EGE05311.1 hypothetical protein TEQG_04466 [Trichophyton equinum CBS 127.97]KAG5205988.1 hypothetical protein GY631_6640 [Trichophyton interdigitale]GBF63862.1 hypothetical protein TMEN_6524 [Trichophyton mentagrophytes]KAG5217442.1 hypothetical protein GY632_6555 [Trichophyton interdigitale]